MADNPYSAEYDQSLIEKIDQTLAIQKSAYAGMPYPSADYRIADLKALKQAILSHEQALVDALNQDFGCRSADDSKIADIMPTVMGINYAIKRVKKWMKPSKRHVGMMFQPAKAYVMYQPLGVVGIITPWNYPVFLALGPLTTALAAGNRAMIKMSEFTPATNKVIASMIASVFPEDKVAIIDGGPSVAAHFSSQPFDHMLFTGSTRVGKLVMAAAAQHLTPVTLELGGKSPTIIGPDMAIDEGVSRFILGKTLNAGQTCVAPDYILCPNDKIDAVVSACKAQFNTMYPSINDNADYGSIINDAQFERLTSWLGDAKEKGAEILPLSEETTDKSVRKIPLTLVTNVNDDMTLMQEEIFGPLLPIIGYDSIEEAMQYVNDRPRPLALYVISFDKTVQKQLLEGTHAGGMCINDATLHVAQDDMPFGGIGPSGMGHYHGHEGFLTLSKAKSVFAKGKFNSAKMAIPPFGKPIHKMLYKMFLR
ncbi:coniferyl aldehyde dehydrogenase [Thalassotalea agarivorans]|uniref:Aldehyde dehydrogenase n=1 Tax=Thalassotalea agarivorans TaxID=349064 RepID=A0A1H9YNL0_THASX|nr:coniferyl aldehyde dehydrogenase [Thalassotalea agarivorans]SES70714.1 coniferyl-aldehyde dehydrogenase [Thalassotalea agarivorans]